VVEEWRRLFLVENVRIHLDEVAGLGSFVELEAVLPNGERLPELADALGIRDSDLIAGSYLDLLLRSLDRSA